jgi:integration host factor subunit alpha
MMLDELTSALSRNENVKLSSFGAFVVRSKKKRFGRNPRTGAAATIAARRVVTFRASQTLRDRLAATGASETPLAAENVSRSL